MKLTTEMKNKFVVAYQAHAKSDRHHWTEINKALEVILDPIPEAFNPSPEEVRAIKMFCAAAKNATMGASTVLMPAYPVNILPSFLEKFIPGVTQSSPDDLMTIIESDSWGDKEKADALYEMFAWAKKGYEK